MAIKSKPGAKKKLILRTSPYDIPEVVLELVSKICLAVDTSNYPERLGKPLRKIVFGDDDNSQEDKRDDLCLRDYFFKNRNLFSNKDFFFDIVNAIRGLGIEIRTIRENSNVRIVVAGSFGAGKSTFINALVGETDFLPVSNQPTTSVATSIYFTPKESGCRVKAVNLKGVVVTLDERILQVIRHKQDQNKRKVPSASDFILSVVKEIFIETKSERFSGYTFIDTPGFGNSDKTNDFNGKSDDQVASEVFQGADFLLWVTDRQLDEQDLKHISMFKGPFAVMLNKVGENTGTTKGISEIVEKIEANFSMLHSSAFHGDTSQIVDVFAYSYSPDIEEIRYSQNHYATFDDIISVARKCKPATYKHPHLGMLSGLLESEIENTRKAIEYHEARLKAFGEHLHYLFNQKEKKISDRDIQKWLENEYTKNKEGFHKMTELKEHLNAHIEVIKKFRRILLETIRSGEEKYKEDIKVQDATTHMRRLPSIFEAIDSGDDLIFRQSLDGVDLYQTNNDGYTPLTYAVKSGNNTMVRILLELGALPEDKDGNGKTALHVASECQFRDMCEILMSRQPNNILWEEKTIDGKTALQLARQNTFYKWLKNNYSNKKRK